MDRASEPDEMALRKAIDKFLAIKDATPVDEQQQTRAIHAFYDELAAQNFGSIDSPNTPENPDPPSTVVTDTKNENGQLQKE